MKNWEFEDESGMLSYLVGKAFGDDPLTQVEHIRKVKGQTADYIRGELRAGSGSVALELGSGAGWISRAMAPKVRHLHCCDISQSFLQLAQRECEHLNNVSFHQIQPGVLAPIPSESIDAAYAHNVFIHLNLYEIAINLKELARVVKPGGTVWLDFLSAEKFTDEIPPLFEEFESHYRIDPGGIGRMVHFQSSGAVIGLAKAAGLKLLKHSPIDKVQHFVTFTRVN